MKASLQHRTVYQFRHTYAALQLSRGENPQYVAHQMDNTNLEMIIRHYARGSRRPERVGTLAHQLSTKFPSKKPEISLKIAVASAPNARGVAIVANRLILLGEIVERAIGIEPMTSSLGSWHSTAELRPLATDCPIAVEIFQAFVQMTGGAICARPMRWAKSNL